MPQVDDGSAPSPAVRSAYSHVAEEHQRELVRCELQFSAIAAYACDRFKPLSYLRGDRAAGRGRRTAYAPDEPHAVQGESQQDAGDSEGRAPQTKVDEAAANPSVPLGMEGREEAATEETPRYATKLQPTLPEVGAAYDVLRRARQRVRQGADTFT